MIKPIKNYLLIEEEAKTETTESGIFIGKQENRYITGTVVAVGSTVRDIKQGDKVIASTDICNILSVEDKEFYHMQESLVLTILG